MEQRGLIFTKENCISCNKCVRVCTSPGASYLEERGEGGVVQIHEDRCIACGACFSLCEHDARDYLDDTEAFFADLQAGEPISLLLAPSFMATYWQEYGSILGGLKKLGVKRIISVSFGADICTWAYIKYMQEHDFYGGISSSCPVVVSYAEHLQPELIPRLMPVHSPMMCAAIYCKEELGITDKLAFLGPCIGKRLETMEKGSYVDYNVTFLKFMRYVREHGIYGEDTSDEVESGLGNFYPAPGGLSYNLRWFLGDDLFLREVSGKTYLYGWLRQNGKEILGDENPFALIDALNCRNGCIEGTASEMGGFKEDRALAYVVEMKNRAKRKVEGSPWNASLSQEERLRLFNLQFASLDLTHYLRTFTDRSAACQIHYPSPEEAEEIFLSMHKATPESRQINCATCGYRSCYQLMVAIYNRLNTKKSCIHYNSQEAIRLERLSFCDQLTSVMNRNALEKLEVGVMFTGKSLAVIVVDVNGLKEVNDTLGHDAGDRLIVNVASALAAVFSRDNVYRTGGDEFMVILQDHLEEECADSIRRAKEILKAKGASIAVGYAYQDHFMGDLEQLQEQADKAMYQDKEEHYRRVGKKPR